MTLPLSRRAFLASGLTAAVPPARADGPRSDIHRQLLGLAAEQERRRRAQLVLYPISRRLPDGR